MKGSTGPSKVLQNLCATPGTEGFQELWWQGIHPTPNQCRGHRDSGSILEWKDLTGEQLVQPPCLPLNPGKEEPQVATAVHNA